MAQNGGSLEHGVCGGDAAVRPDFKDQLVVVSHLPHTGILHRILHAGNRRENGVDRNHADGHIRHLVFIAGGKTAAHANLEFAFEHGVLVQSTNDLIGIDHLVNGVVGNIGSSHNALLMHAQREQARFLAVMLEFDLFQVQHDFRHIFHHTGQGGKFMLRTGDADGGNGGAFKRTQKNAAQGVAKRMAVTVFKRFRHKGQMIRIIRIFNFFQTAGNLKTGQRGNGGFFCSSGFVFRHNRM